MTGHTCDAKWYQLNPDPRVEDMTHGGFILFGYEFWWLLFHFDYIFPCFFEIEIEITVLDLGQLATSAKPEKKFVAQEPKNTNFVPTFIKLAA
jgi:hypothetical protein